MAQQLTFSVNVDTREATASVNQFFDTIDQGAARAKSKLNSALGEKVTKQVDIQFKNGELIAKQIEGMNTKSQKLKQTWNAIKGPLGQNAKALKDQQRILQELINKTNRFSGATKKVNKDWQTLSDRLKQVNKALSEQSGSGGNFLKGLTGKFAVANVASQLFVEGLKNIGKAIVEVAQTGAEMELLALQLEAFTGSAEEADKAFASFKNTAIKTPFNLEQVAQAGRILLAFGVDTDTATESIRNLSIIAGSTGGDINNLARNLGQISSQGRAFTRDLTQFAIQGIPIWEELSVVTGKSTVELRKMAAEGTIGFDEVNQALKNMTAEGSAFASVAGKISNTWVGIGQAISTEFQDLAKTVVEGFNEIDEATGGFVKGSAQNLLTTMRAITAVLETLTPLVANLGRAFGNLNPAIGVQLRLKDAVGALSDKYFELLQNIERLGAPLREFLNIPHPIREAAAETAKLAENTKYTKEELNAITQGKTYQQIVEETKKAVKAQEALNNELTLELDKLKEIGEQADKMYEKQIQDLEASITLKKDAIQAEKDGYAEIAAAMKSRHEEERSELDAKLRTVKDIYDTELSKIQELTPAQKRLQEIRAKELQDRASNQTLTEKERVSAQAQLDTMKQQAKAAEIRKAKEAEVKKIEEEKLALAAKQKAEKEEIKKKHEEELAILKDSLDQQQAELKEIKAERKDIADKVKEMLDNEGRVNQEVKNVSASLQAQFGVVDTLAAKYAKLAAQAERFAAAASAGSSAGGGQQNRFAGGSVTGGTPYTVNEFGQEAFLSAAGKLSMINAPSWGTWRAPGAGTVIPAHLTKQLDIPSGGVQVGAAAAAQTSRAASNGGDIARALKGLSGGNGDRVTNNVTIQAANTTQAASDMMMQLNRIRRRRMG